MKKSSGAFFKNHWVFFVLLFLFVITRFLILLTNFDYDREDNAFGIISNKILSGDFESIYDLRHSPYQMGYLLDGLIVSTSFLLFGESYISLQFTNFFYSIPIFFFLYFFLYRFFNRKIAIMASSLFVFSPYLYQFGNLALSQYPRAFIFVISITYFFYKIFYENKKTLLNFIALGILSGLALFVNYISVITILTCVIFWFIFDKKFFLRKEFLTFFLAFLIGFSPWIYGSMVNHFDSMDQFYLISKPVTSGDYYYQSSIPDRAKDILLFSFPQAFSLDNLIFIHYFYYTVFILSIFYILYTNRNFFRYIFTKDVDSKKIKEIFFVLFIIIFLVIFILADLIIPFFSDRKFWNWRYYLFVYPVIFIIISSALFGFLKKNSVGNKRIRKTSKLFFFLIFGFLMSFGIFSSTKAINMDNLDHFINKDPKALSYERTSDNLMFKISLDKSVDICSNLDTGYKYLCYYRLIIVHYNSDDYAGLKKLIETDIDNKYKTDASFIFGQLAGYTFNLSEALYRCKTRHFSELECYFGVIWSYVQKEEFAKNCESFYDTYSEICEYGLIEKKLLEKGFSIEDCKNFQQKEYCEERFSWNMGFVQNTCGDVSEQYEKYCFFAIGSSLADLYKEKYLTDCVENNYMKYCEEGFSWKLGWRFGNNPLAGGEICNSLPYPNNKICLNAMKKEFDILPFDEFIESYEALV